MAIRDRTSSTGLQATQGVRVAPEHGIDLLCCAWCGLLLAAMGCSAEGAHGESQPTGSAGSSASAGGSSGNTAGASGNAAGPDASRITRLDVMGSIHAVFWDDSGATAYLAGQTVIQELSMESFTVTRTVVVTVPRTTDAWGLVGSGAGVLLSTADQVYLRDLATETDQAIITCSECSMPPIITAAAISHDDRWVAATSANEQWVFLRDRTAGPETQVSVQPIVDLARTFRGVAFAADDSELYVHDSQLLYVLRLPELEVTRTLPSFPSPTTMPSPTGSIVLVPGQEVILQRADSGAALLPLDGSPGTVVHLDYPGSSVSVSRDGTLAAITTLTYDPTISSVWVVDLDTLAATKLFTSEPEGERVEAAFVSPDARYVLAPFGTDALDIYALD